MRKIRWGDLLIFGGALFIIYFVVSASPTEYADFFQNPNDHGSGTSRSRIFYFITYKIDQWIGRTGIVGFFSFWALFFLYHFLNNNMCSFQNRYQDWKETGDWKKLFRNK